MNENIILVTGSNNILNNAFRNLKSKNIFIFVNNELCNLNNYNELKNFFKEIQPSHVIHFKGSIQENYHLLKCCYEFNIKKAIFCLSSNIISDRDYSEYPVNEKNIYTKTDLHTKCKETDEIYNEKILEIMCARYREKYNCNFLNIIYCDYYGDGHPKDSFLNLLIKNCLNAKEKNTKFEVPGTGMVKKQFIYANDLVRIIEWCLFNYLKKGTLIVSSDADNELSVAKLAITVSEVLGYKGYVKFSSFINEEIYCKTVDNSKLKKEFSEIIDFTPLETGILNTYEYFLDNY